MIFKLIYENGESEIKYFTIDELFNSNILSAGVVEEYFNKYLFLSEDNIESWWFSETDYNVTIDLRLLNYKKELIINGKVAQLQLMDVGTYEYTVGIMGLGNSDNIYLQGIWLEEKNNEADEKWLMDHFRKN